MIIRFLIAALLIGIALVFMPLPYYQKTRDCFPIEYCIPEGWRFAPPLWKRVWKQQPSFEKLPPANPPEDVTPPLALSPDEKERIDSWIRQNNLNTYGDPQDTMYAGGTPLFDEGTGQTTDRYEYILKRHPNRPWNK